jgi:flagellar biosynthesis protein FlhF
MRLKTFRAAGMAAAMAQVRAELGSDALILSTRRISGGIEITAALEPADEPPIAEPSIAEPARLATLAWHGVPPELQTALADGDLEQAIARTLAFGELPLESHGNPVMLAGPPGAGKTLTTARLATRLVMQGITPLVITTDGSRAGAVEQLAAFTRLLGVPLLVASNPASLARALMERQDGAPVLIDTAGTDPFDSVQADDLKALAAAADAQIAVVLPSGLDPGEAADLAVAYRACGAHFLIATRLDIVRRLGGVIAAAAASRLPLTEAGIGPGAADGLISFTPSLLAARLTHIESARNAS